jgi:hypothetical protein
MKISSRVVQRTDDRGQRTVIFEERTRSRLAPVQRTEDRRQKTVRIRNELGPGFRRDDALVQGTED